MQEIWKDVKGYEGGYQVSSLGNVRSLKKKHYLKLLRPSVSKRFGRGYYQVVLSKDGIQNTFKVHVLVASAFLGYTPNGLNSGPVVDHIDNDPLNNNLKNLQIISSRVNSSKDRNGTSKYVGVSYDFNRRKWSARLKHNGKYLFLGRFNDEYEAHLAYQNKLKQITNE